MKKGIWSKMKKLKPTIDAVVDLCRLDSIKNWLYQARLAFTIIIQYQEPFIYTYIHMHFCAAELILHRMDEDSDATDASFML